VELDPTQEVRLDTLDHALTTSLIELNYVRMGPAQSMLDAELTDDRERAMQSFQNTLEDDGEDASADVKVALAWLLNVSDARFRTAVERMEVPYPRFDPVDLRRFLEFLWKRTWSSEDWQVPNFDEGQFAVAYRKPV